MENFDKEHIKKFSFDLDGTLINCKGELNLGVPEFFYEILTTIKNPKICISTANNKQYAQNVVNSINEKLINELSLNKDKILNPEFVTFNGAQIFTSDGELIKSDPISKSQYENIENIASFIDKNALLLAKTDIGLIYKNPGFSVRKSIIINAIKCFAPHINLEKTNIFKLSEDKFNQALNDSKVFAIEILSLNHNLKNQIFKILSGNVQDLSVSYDGTIALNKGSKLQSISHDTNLDNIIHMGDGYEDIPLLKSCGLSYAFGDKVDVLKSAKFAVDNFYDIRDSFFGRIDYSQASQEKIDKLSRKQKNNNIIKMDF